MKFPLILVSPIAGAVVSVANTVISKRAECKNNSESEKTTSNEKKISHKRFNEQHKERMDALRLARKRMKNKDDK